MPYPPDNTCLKVRRPLNFGSKGEDVKEVQKNLIQYGYMDFPADGLFGIVTEEAIKKMQRDYGLKDDGIVGKNTLRLLKGQVLFENRKVHIVKEDENIDDISRLYGVNKTAIMKATGRGGIRMIHPGKAISIYQRKAMGVIDKWSTFEAFFKKIEITSNSIPRDVKTIISPLSTLNKDGRPNITHFESIGKIDYKNHKIFVRIGALSSESNSYNNLIKTFISNERIKDFANEIKSLVNNRCDIRGICFQLMPVDCEFMKHFLHFIRELKSLLELEIEYGVLIPVEIILQDIYPSGYMGKLGDLVTWISLGTPGEGVLGDESAITSNYMDICKAMKRLVDEIPRHKLFLSLFAYGLHRAMGKRNYIKTIGTEQVEKLAYRYGARVKWDREIKAYNFSYRSRRLQHDIWYEGREGLNSRCNLINRCNVKGFLIWYMEYVEELFWSVIKDNFIPKG